MTKEAPVYEIDVDTFHRDPYPDLAEMRKMAPVVYVPQLRASLITRRDDIFDEEKKTSVYSSVQPNGLMTRLMGQNLMRKDGDEHAHERKAIFPAVSPKTVRDVWKDQFVAATYSVIEELRNNRTADLVSDFAMPVSAHALRNVTGLTNMDWREMDRVSQGMIDGCANYLGDPTIEANCHDCTASIDRHIKEVMAGETISSEHSLIMVQRAAGLDKEQIFANIRLAISGGQNEPRDAIAGTAWALLKFPSQFDLIKNGTCSWQDAFEEFSRWMSPIGMSPRMVAKDHELHGHTVKKGSAVFLMFGSGNRDENTFANPDAFDMEQDHGPALTFGAGPHFCAGAWISRTLIAEVALPILFGTFPEMKLASETEFAGWAFRGPKSVRVVLGHGNLSAP